MHGPTSIVWVDLTAFMLQLMAKLPLDMALWNHTTLDPARPDAMVSFCIYHLSWCQLIPFSKQPEACWPAFIM